MFSVRCPPRIRIIIVRGTPQDHEAANDDSSVKCGLLERAIATSKIVHFRYGRMALGVLVSEPDRGGTIWRWTISVQEEIGYCCQGEYSRWCVARWCWLRDSKALPAWAVSIGAG